MAGAEVVLYSAYAWAGYLRSGSLRLGNGYPDFFIYSALGHQLRAHGFADVYDLGLQRSYQHQLLGPHASLLPYISPPYEIPLWWPFGWLDLHSGYVVWGCLVALTIAAGIAALAAGLPSRRSAWSAGLMAAAWVPCLVTVLQGQTSAIVFLGLSLSALAWVSGRHGRSGVAAVLGIARPHMVLLVPPLFLIRSPRRALPAWLLGVLVLVAATFPLAGTANWRAYLDLVLPWLAHGVSLPGVVVEQSPYALRGALDWLRLPGSAQAAVLVIAAVLILVAIHRGRPFPALDFALVTAASVWLSPHQNFHDLLPLLVSLLLAVRLLVREETAYPMLGWAAVAVAYLACDAALIVPGLAQAGTLALVAYLLAARIRAA